MSGPKVERADPSRPVGRLPTARYLARGYVRLLPGRRGAAAGGLVRDLLALITGRGPAPDHAPGDPPVDPATLLRAQRALAAGDAATALENAESILSRHPDSLAALAIRLEVEERRGEPSSALATIRAMRNVRDSASLERAERSTVGRLIETDPRWSVRIPGPSRRLTGDPDIVLRLTAGSDGAGAPAVVVEDRGASSSERYQLSSAWVGPPDEALAAAAWLAARVAHLRRPGLIRVGRGSRGYDTMLVGLAVRDRVGIPLIVDAPSPDDRNPPGSEAATRRRATEDRAMARADGVIAGDAAVRASLLERGVPSDRILVIPLAAPPDVVADMTAAAYGALLARQPRSGDR